MKKIIALFGSALLLLALASVALAHAEIKTCTPAIDGTVETAPDKLVCTGSEAMDAKGSSLEVYDASGMQVDKKDSAVDLNDPDRVTISVSLDTTMMKDGVYTVKWKTLSAADGDAADGEFHFTVGAAMDMGGTTTPAADEPAVTHPNDDHSIGIVTIDGKEVTLKITAPVDDATLPAGPVMVEATVEGVTLGENGYHLHFYLDDALQRMSGGTETSWTMNVEPGTHEIMVSLGDHDHADINNAHVHVTVEGASTAAQATAAPTEVMQMGTETPAEEATAAVATAAPTEVAQAATETPPVEATTAAAPAQAATETPIVEATTAPAPAQAATETPAAEATTAAVPTEAPTEAPTLPQTGESVNYGLIALIAIVGLMVLGAGAMLATRGRR